jgi:hypothetical protein
MEIHYRFSRLLPVLLLCIGLVSCGKKAADPVPTPAPAPVCTTFTLFISQFGYNGNPLIAIRSTMLLPDPAGKRSSVSSAIGPLMGGGAMATDPVKKLVYFVSTFRAPRYPFHNDTIKRYDVARRTVLSDVVLPDAAVSPDVYTIYSDIALSGDGKFLYVIRNLNNYTKSTRQRDLLKVALSTQTVAATLSLDNTDVSKVCENPVNKRLYLAGVQTILSTDAGLSNPVSAYVLPGFSVTNIVCSSDGNLWASGNRSIHQFSTDQTGKAALLRSVELPKSIALDPGPPYPLSTTVSNPGGLVFGPDGSLYVGSSPNGRVFRFDRTTNQFNPDAYYAYNNTLFTYQDDVLLVGLAIVCGEP